MIAGPDSHAQIAIQAAERLRELGAGVPWEVAPPAPPAAIAALSAVPGITPESAYLLLVVAAFAGSAIAAFRLWRIMGGSAGLALQAAVLALLAPSGWLAVFERGEIDRLLFWKLVPFVFLAIDGFRRKPNLVRLGLVSLPLAAMALTRSSRVIAFDALALTEWVVLFALCRPWRADTYRMRLVRVAGAVVFVSVALLRLAAEHEPGALAPMPARLVEQAPSPTVGPVSLEARLSWPRGQIHELIDGDLRPHESVLWLQALGAQSAIAPAHGKLARQLECVAEQDGWCVFETGSPAPPAVLVSRERFESLQPIRGLFDVEGLERYLAWAMRPEAVGFEREGNQVRIDADAGPDDLILARLRAADWSPKGLADPLGFVVLDPGGAGPFEAALTFDPSPQDDVALDTGEYPRILPEGVVEATAFAPPPFQPGAYVSIFGKRFRPDGSVVMLDGALCTVTFLSSTQINIRLPEDVAPGRHELVVNSANRYSYPYRFEVAAP